MKESVILTAPLAGLENQARGLAEAAGLAPAIRHLAGRGLAGRLPPALWFDPVATVGGVPEAAGRLVIGVGGLAGAVGAALHRRGAHPVVQVQNPRVPLRHFSLVVVGRHDEVRGPNVVVTRTALHRASPPALAAARATWAGRLAPAGGRLAAVLLGGSNGRFTLNTPVAARLGADLARIMRAEPDLAVVATASRRTAPAAVAAIRAAIGPLGGTVWDGAGENPYLGMLALADTILVTSDSVSMVSEAVATAAPVYVAALPGRSRRIGLFLAGLARDGRIRSFTGRLDRFPAAPLDDTAEAAQEMRRRLAI